ncbi:hypothetical protein FRC00_006701 [Tulasnella sp. 408]|nr:hypothetical protein FRC00_006701 [Tulasnella sp. 408]
MASPKKHLHMGDFSKYYTGEEVAPILTVIIGGNHEASNYMWELYHGGFVAPNMYYLGAAGVVQFNGIRIAGLSGIYKDHDYARGHNETIPYNLSSMRSVYHVRQYDVQRILQLSPLVDICISHDWPHTIERYGDHKDLVHRRSHLKAGVAAGTIGCPPFFEILKKVRPSRWFAGHMHVKFEATVNHEGPDAGTTAGAQPSSSAATEANPKEIVHDRPSAPSSTESEPAPKPSPSLPSSSTSQSSPGASETQFLALDQCLPNRDYLEVIYVCIVSLPHIILTYFFLKIIDFPAPLNSPKLTFDAEWLGIVRATHQYFSRTKTQEPLPPDNVLRPLIEENVRWVKENVGENKDVTEVQAFVAMAPGPDPAFSGDKFPKDNGC